MFQEAIPARRHTIFSGDRSSFREAIHRMRADQLLRSGKKGVKALLDMLRMALWRCTRPPRRQGWDIAVRSSRKHLVIVRPQRARICSVRDARKRHRAYGRCSHLINEPTSLSPFGRASSPQVTPRKDEYTGRGKEKSRL